MPKRTNHRGCALYLIAGFRTAPNFMAGLRDALVERLQGEGCEDVYAELLFPYGDWSRGALGQLRSIRRDMRLGLGRRERSIGGRFVAAAVRATAQGRQPVLLGHSGGGVAAVHAAQLLLGFGGAAGGAADGPVCPVVQIGSPKCAVPAQLRSTTGYLFGAGAEGRRIDPICRLGSWGGFTSGRFGVPQWRRGLHTPTIIAPLPIIGGHADYFREQAPYIDEYGRSNLDLTMSAVWPLISGVAEK